jgi:hypothetical protein
MSEDLLNSRLMQVANVANKLNDPHYKTCTSELNTMLERMCVEVMMF